jgi:hypothetical protein
MDEQIVRLLDKLSKRVENLEILETPATVPWTDYSAISTIIGWTTYTYKQIYYLKIGNLVIVEYYILGTSNSTATSFTLPYALKDLVALQLPVRIVDNGAAHVWGLQEIYAGASLVSFYSTVGGASWTASGGKYIAGQFFYES